MLSWYLSKEATNFGEAKSFLHLFLDVSVAKTFDVCGKDSSSDLRKLTSSSWCDNSCDVEEVDAIFFSFFIFHFSLPWPLFFLSIFFYLPPPNNPDDLVLSVCVRTFYLPLFSFFRGHPRVRYQISYPNPFGISRTAAYKYLGISYNFFEAPAKHDEDSQVSLHSLERISWYSRLFPKDNALANNKICAFTYSQFNFPNIKKKTTRICLFDGSFAPVIWWFAAPTK